MAKKTRYPPRQDILPLIRDGELTVKVTPNAGDISISLPAEMGPAGVLLVRVTATPENGKANAAVLKLLSKALGLPKTSLRSFAAATREPRPSLFRIEKPSTVWGIRGLLVQSAAGKPLYLRSEGGRWVIGGRLPIIPSGRAAASMR